MKLLLKTFLMIVSLAAVGSLSGNTADQRKLKFFHTHTGDTLDVIYYRQGDYNPEALAEVRVFLADWRDGKQHDLDPQLIRCSRTPQELCHENINVYVTHD